MSSSSTRIGRIGLLALAIAALALTSAGIADAHAAPKPNPRVTALLERHFQHEDALYGTRYTRSDKPTPVDAMALHFNHEDAIYGGRQEILSTRTPAQMMALHFNHEDALYRAHALASRRAHVALPAEATARDAFDWKDALVGAGTTVALLLLGASAMVAFRRGRSRLVQS